MTECQGYRRPAGILGGPCLECGRSQPEHTGTISIEYLVPEDVIEKLKVGTHPETSVTLTPMDKIRLELRDTLERHVRTTNRVREKDEPYPKGELLCAIPFEWLFKEFPELWRTK